MIPLSYNTFLALFAILTFITTPCGAQNSNLMQAIRQIGISVSLPPNLLNTQRSVNPQPCVFQCPSGYSPVPRPGHVPKYNGCGSYGFERLLIPEVLPFVECCNLHDICYDTCGASKFDCDRRFQSCLQSKCRVQGSGNGALRNSQTASLDMALATGSCTSSAELIATGPIIAGCNAYMISQMNACACP